MESTQFTIFPVMSDLPPGFLFGVVLLGAGRSRRMGQSKLVLPWRGTSVIGHLIRVWGAVGARQIAVVCAGDRMDVAGELDRLGFGVDSRIVNPDPDRGMFSSIQCAAKWPGWVSELTHYVIALGDQPHFDQAMLSRLCAFAAEHAGRVCQPAYRGRLAHPVIFPGKEFHELAGAETRDLREFLQQRTVAACEIDDPGLVLDMDTPDEYRRLSGTN